MVEALVCKTSLSGFESRRYLHFLRTNSSRCRMYFPTSAARSNAETSHD